MTVGQKEKLATIAKSKAILQDVVNREYPGDSLTIYHRLRSSRNFIFLTTTLPQKQTVNEINNDSRKQSFHTNIKMNHTNSRANIESGASVNIIDKHYLLLPAKPRLTSNHHCTVLCTNHKGWALVRENTAIYIRLIKINKVSNVRLNLKPLKQRPHHVKITLQQMSSSNIKG